MPRLPAWLERYRALPRGVHVFAAGQFLINLIQTAQFLLLNLFLTHRGLDDPSIAALTSQRFVATFFLAIPAMLGGSLLTERQSSCLRHDASNVGMSPGVNTATAHVGHVKLFDRSPNKWRPQQASCTKWPH